MSAPLRIGDLLEGFCNGQFGRDSYNNKRVEAIGADWVVVRDVDNWHAEFASCSPDDLVEYRI